MKEKKWNASEPTDDGWFKHADNPKGVCKPISEAAHKFFYNPMNSGCFE